MSDNLLLIQLLGTLCTTRDAQITTRFRTRKTGALLACLAYHRKRSFRRDELVELLWPDSDLEAGRNGFRVALNALHHHLEPSDAAAAPLIVADRLHVSLNPAAYTTDTDRFERLVKTAQRAKDKRERVELFLQAAALYRGELLSGYQEAWIPGERQRLADQHLLALRHIVQLLVQLRDVRGALDYARRMVQADPLREASHRNVMQLYVSLGRPGEALRQFSELTELLRVEVGHEPSEASRDLAARIGNACDGVCAPTSHEMETNEHVALQFAQETMPSLSAADWPPSTGAVSRLPRLHTEFFGRETEIQSLKRWLLSVFQELAAAHPFTAEAGAASDAEGSAVRRLDALDSEGRSAPANPRIPENRDATFVTLTGMGGSGKTRLALATAEQMQQTLDAAVFYVPLADLTQPALIPDAILTALQLPRQAHLTAKEQVIGALSRRPTLLVLDNLEHLIAEGAPLLSTLMTRAPQLLCLVTSRQRLNLAGEYEYAVAPLPTPATPGTPARLLEFACVQLFVDRARAVRSDFELDASNAASVAALCHHLEGVPLAIELAAAYVQVMSPAQILVRLTPRLKLLVNRAYDASPRHASLRAALAWSFDLLTPPVQRFLSRLSVFRGGWTLEAAEAIFEAQAADTQRPEATQNWEERFPTPNAQRPTPSFCDALECLMQLRERSLVTVEEKQGGMRFGLLETVREFAAEKLCATERLEAMRAHREYHLQLAESARPHLTGSRAAEQLDLLESEHDNLRAALSYASEDGLAWLRLADTLWLYWYIRGYNKEGSEWLERAIQAVGTTAPVPLRASTLMGAGNLAYGRKDLSTARSWYEAHLALAREVGDVHGEAKSLGSLGNVANDEGDHERARELLTGCLAVFERLGDPYRVALAQDNLAVACTRLGDYRAARPLHEQSLAYFRSIDDKENVALALVNTVSTLLYVEDIGGAASRLAESLEMIRDLKDKRCVAFALSSCVKIAIHHRAFRQAGVVMGALDELRSRTGIPDSPAGLETYQRERATVESTLGEPAFSSALLQGRGMSLEQATSYALEEMKQWN